MHKRSRSWLVPAGLIALTAIPAIAGSVRLGQLATHAPVTPENERFFAMPLPVVLHIVGALLYCLLGAFQFAPRLRRRHPRWHRTAGYVLIPAGLTVAVTGVFMAFAYDLPPVDGVAVQVERLIVGTVMVTAIILALLAIRRRDIREHRAWMIRAYALGQGAGTQAVTQLPWILLVGQPGVGPRAVLMGAAWVINAAVAEWIIRRQGAPRASVGQRRDAHPAGYPPASAPRSSVAARRPAGLG
jgi:uncharacterized membrane protein